MIAVIDYGAGNIRSVYKALKHIGCECVITRDKDEIMNADGAVLPGVGSFGDTMDTMNSYGIKDTVIKYINSEKPFLGICLGLQRYNHKDSVRRRLKDSAHRLEQP